ncbi:MAG: DegT/DnrJ/EryC1/StrS family aminotransferase [Microgenomates group bacterium]
MFFKIPLSKPYITKTDLRQIKKCFDTTWISSKSPYVNKFEQKFAKIISKTKYSVAVNSGTSALFLALKTLNIGQQDEVIIPSFTMIATINAVVWAGAKPILVDSQSKSDWNINIDQIEKKITKKTKAIIPVHVYGYVCQMNKILRIARKYGLYVIEDAAEAMGSTYKDKFAGSFGDISCFSLYSNKIITTGNGGILATNSKKIYEKAKKLSFFDFNPKRHFLHYNIGYNLVITGLQASLGISQLDKFHQLLENRRKIFKLYFKYLHKNKKISFIFPEKGIKPNYWFPAIIFKLPKDKNKVKKILEKEGIETRNFFIPIHRQPIYKDMFKNEDFPNADFFYKRGLLLPSYYQLTEKDILFITKIINNNL